MTAVRLRVLHPAGLHARTAGVFVAEASRFISTIRVRSVAGDTTWVDGKSILSVLTLGVEGGHEIEISAEGPDEAEAASSLESLIRSDFSGRL
jgi:phosphotransferase system HPr (HPr) family protein